MERHSLKDIAWSVSEDIYRNDPAISYSMLSRFLKKGFEGLQNMFDKIESPSLTFGAIVDCLLTEPKEEFEKRFFITENLSVTDSVRKIVDRIYEKYSNKVTELNYDFYPEIFDVIQEFNYQPGWKHDTRVKSIRDKGFYYYEVLKQSENKTVIDKEDYKKALECINAIRLSPANIYFSANLFDTNIELFNQLKFKTTINDINVRCMFDCILVDHKSKTIQPADLKTTSKKEWQFSESFNEWNYWIQSRLYVKILSNIIKNDDYYKDFEIKDFIFVVINKDSLYPLMFVDSKCKEFEESYKTIDTGTNITPIPELMSTLNFYLTNMPKLPIGFKDNEPNDIYNCQSISI